MTVYRATVRDGKMRKLLIYTGLAISTIYVVTVWLLIGGKLGDFEWLSLNELGDFLAGTVGPLTLIWLVFGFVQQGYQLEDNSKALKLQADELRMQATELRNSVEQQRRLAEIAEREHAANLKTLDLREQQIQEEREATRLAQLARLVFMPGEWRLNPPFTAGELVLYNAGAPCYRMRAHIDYSMSEIALLGPSDVPLLRDDMNVTFRFQGGDHVHTHNTSLRLDYRDVAGRHISERYSITVRDGRIEQIGGGEIIRPDENPRALRHG